MNATGHIGHCISCLLLLAIIQTVIWLDQTKILWITGHILGIGGIIKRCVINSDIANGILRPFLGFGQVDKTYES